MPGATTARLVVCALEMPTKLSMMPHTVPNNPTNGAVAPMVARMPEPRAILRLAAISMRSSCQATRSLSPSARRLAEKRISLAAACIKCATGPAASCNCSCACASVLHSASVRRPRRTAVRADRSSRLFAIHTVQVTNDANASPIITTFTMTLA